MKKMKFFAAAAATAAAAAAAATLLLRRRKAKPVRPPFSPHGDSRVGLSILFSPPAEELVAPCPMGLQQEDSMNKEGEIKKDDIFRSCRSEFGKHGMEGFCPVDCQCSTCCSKSCRLFYEPDSEESGDLGPPISSIQCQEKCLQKCVPDDDGSFSISNGSPAMFCGKSCSREHGPPKQGTPATSVLSFSNLPRSGVLQKPLVQAHALNEDPTSDWKATKLVNRDGKLELYTDVFFASFDQASDEANGSSACAPLAVVIAHWLLTNEHSLPTKSEFDELIRDGSREWRRLKKLPKYRREVPHGQFNIKEIVNEKIRPIAESDSDCGTFHPIDAGVIASFDQIWDKISEACSELEANGSPLIYIFCCNGHFFVLKVEHDTCYIIDTLRSRFIEGCNQGYILKFDENTSIKGLMTKASTGNRLCKEYIKSFLAARWIGELEADMNNGVVVDEFQIQQLFLFEINRMVISRSSKPRTTLSRPSRRIVSGIERSSLPGLSDSPTSDWKTTKLVSHDDKLELSTYAFFASFDQASEEANGSRACAPLAAVIAHWLLTHEHELPKKSEFDDLIRAGSKEWRDLKELPKYRNSEFRDGDFDIQTIVTEKIRPLSFSTERYYGSFNPIDDGLDSFDKIWGEISKACSELKPNGSPLIYIFGWNRHFFVLKVEHDACFIIDTLRSRLIEGCNRGYILKFDENTSIEGLVTKANTVNELCKEYIKSFLAARWVGELAADMNNGMVVDGILIQQFFHFEINRMVISRSSKPITNRSRPSRRIVSGIREQACQTSRICQTPSSEIDSY